MGSQVAGLHEPPSRGEYIYIYVYGKGQLQITL